MKGVMLIARRELGAYFNSFWGYLVVAVILIINGLLFNAFALGDNPKLSFEVLRDFFYFSFGTTVIASILITMRLIAEERQTGTITLIHASPLSEWQVIFGKYLSAMVFLGVMLVLSGYMPALVFVNGKVSLGHIFSGYLGLFLVGSATVAIGTFASTLSRSQLVAAVVGGVISVFLLVTWLLARIADPPLKEIFSYMSLFDRHFRRTFMEGQIHTNDVVFYLSITFVFLVLSTRWISARRWK
jgi:ABC-2 type transport system permease protein